MFCPSCGLQLPEESLFCLKCGRSMSVAPNAAARVVDVAAGKRPGLARGILLGLLVIAGVIVAAYQVKVHSARTAERPSDKEIEQDAATPAAAAAAVAVGTKTRLAPPIAAPAPSPPTPPPPVKLSPGEIAAKNADAVVVLESYNEQGQKFAQGSGFLASQQGKVLTNYHVIRGASRMVARLRDQSMHDVESISGFDMQHDVAALNIGGHGLPSVHLGSSSTVKTGDHVTALGAPLGLESTLSDGIISAVREFGSFRLFQTSTPISHGSSGGPLFNDFGDVIALVVSTVETGENLNFAVPLDSARPLLTNDRQTSFAELLSKTAVRQPILHVFSGNQAPGTGH